MNLLHTAVLLFPLVLGSSTPAKSENLRIFDSPRAPQKSFCICLVFFFSGQKRCDGELLRCFLQLVEHPAVWLEAFFELSNNFDVPIH
jgi:hypothetical protein